MLSRAISKALSFPFPPRNVAARIWLRLEFSLAIKASVKVNVLSEDESIKPAIYTFPPLSTAIASAKSVPLPPRNVAERIGSMISSFVLSY